MTTVVLIPKFEARIFLLLHAEAGLRLVGNLNDLFLGRFRVEYEGICYEVSLPSGVYFALEVDELPNGGFEIPFCSSTDRSVICRVCFAPNEELSRAPSPTILATPSARGVSLSARRPLLSPEDIQPMRPSVARSIQSLLGEAVG